MIILSIIVYCLREEKVHIHVQQRETVLKASGWFAKAGNGMVSYPLGLGLVLVKFSFV